MKVFYVYKLTALCFFKLWMLRPCILLFYRVLFQVIVKISAMTINTLNRDRMKNLQNVIRCCSDVSMHKVYIKRIGLVDIRGGGAALAVYSVGISFYRRKEPIISYMDLIKTLNLIIVEKVIFSKMLS